MTIGRIFDCIALAYIRLRLGQCEQRGDSADRFADAITEALHAELERRGRCLDEDDLRRHRERHKKV